MLITIDTPLHRVNEKLAMNPNPKHVVITTERPPRPGDRYLHKQYGEVRLIKMAGGDSFHCELTWGKRIILRPKEMTRLETE